MVSMHSSILILAKIMKRSKLCATRNGLSSTRSDRSLNSTSMEVTHSDMQTTRRRDRELWRRNAKSTTEVKPKAAEPVDCATTTFTCASFKCLHVDERSIIRSHMSGIEKTLSIGWTFSQTNPGTDTDTQERNLRSTSVLKHTDEFRNAEIFHSSSSC